MSHNVDPQVIACLRGLSAGCKKIASLHAQGTAELQAAKTAAAPKPVDDATKQLMQTVSTKVASLFEISGASPNAVSSHVSHHTGTLDILNKVLDVFQSSKTAATSAVNSPAVGLGRPANPAAQTLNKEPQRGPKVQVRRSYR